MDSFVSWSPLSYALATSRACSEFFVFTKYSNFDFILLIRSVGNLSVFCVEPERFGAMFSGQTRQKAAYVSQPKRLLM